jgi:hypothetical protein
VPINDPSAPGGHRMLAGELPGGRFAPPSVRTGRTFDISNPTKAVHSPGAFDDSQSWMDAAHSMLPPEESEVYTYRGDDLIDYYNGMAPEVSAAAAVVRYEKRRNRTLGRIQSPLTSDGLRAHNY